MPGRSRRFVIGCPAVRQFADWLHGVPTDWQPAHSYVGWREEVREITAISSMHIRQTTSWTISH
jgi:hypothetical protein